MRGSKDNITTIVVKLPGASLASNGTNVVHTRRQARPEHYWVSEIGNVPDEN